MTIGEMEALQDRLDPRRANHYFVFSLALLTLMFIQSTRQFVASIYYENLTGMGFSPTILYLVAFLASLLLVLASRVHLNLIMMLSACSIIVHRIYGSLDSEPSLFVLFHTIVIVSYAVFLPSFLALYYSLHEEDPEAPRSGGISTREAIAAAPALAVLLDIVFTTIGDSLDSTVAGISDSAGKVIVPGLLITVGLAVFAAPMLRSCYRVVERHLPAEAAVRPGNGRDSPLVPGMLFGFLLMLLFTFLGYPGIVIRWTPGSYVVAVLSASFCLALLVVLLQLAKSRNLLFAAPVQAALNLIQYFVILDVMFLDTGAAQYLIGVALVSLLLDLHVLFSARGRKAYSLSYLARLCATGIIAFLILFFMSTFSLLWAYVGTLGAIFKGKYLYILIAISTVYILCSMYYATTAFAEGGGGGHRIQGAESRHD
jgi:hypothetical protein